jgi:putative transposase
MNTPTTNRYKNHCFPAEIISHAVWLYFRFCLSYRDVEELLLGVPGALAGKFTPS